MLQRAGIGLVLLLGLLMSYLLFWPVAPQPEAWRSQAMPSLTNQLAVNQKLKAITVIAKVLTGPEDILLSPDGWIYTGTADGNIVRYHEQKAAHEIVANTKGRPLGLEFASNGDIIIADAVQGLLQLNVQSNPPELTLLLKEVDGKTMKFVDDVAVSQAGKVYFSDASQRWGIHDAAVDVIENAATGRIIEYDLRTGRHRVLMPGLSFANGVALDAEEASLFVNETGRYRLHRLWLTGERASQSEIFADNLPGFPDNISFNAESGIVWVALFAPRNALLDSLSGYPFWRKVLLRLPKSVQPEPVKKAFVLGFNGQGEVVHNLQYEAPDAYAPITSVEQRGDRLYFGSLEANGIGWIDLPSQ